MGKVILFICFLVFMLGTANAVTLSMSPPQLDFQGKVGETICLNVTMKTLGNVLVVGEDKWAEEGFSERKLSMHKLGAKELHLELNYVEELEINEKEIFEVCLNGESSGNFHGLLLYKIKDKPVKIGIWINVTLEKSGLIKMTGESINIREKAKPLNILAVSTIFLLVIFLGLVFRFRSPK